jgi:antitoxin YobK
MRSLDDLVTNVKAAGHKVEFSGGQSEANINELEAAIGLTLPPSFREFLRTYGGGGVVSEWISGIYKNQPYLTNKGSVYGDTIRCRERYGLPTFMIVIYTQENDEVVWCLDTRKATVGGECPVVSFIVENTTPPVQIADSFDSFFRDYLEMHCE